MLTPAAHRLLSAALLSGFVGLCGCHVSFGSSSSSKSPNSSQGKPARKSPSKTTRPANTSSKPINSKSASKPVADSKPASEPAPTKTDDGPTRNDAGKTDDGPKRTKPTSDPHRLKPAEPDAPTHEPKHVGGRGDTKTPAGPGNLVAPQ